MNTEGTALALRVIALHGTVQRRLGGALSMHGIGLSEYLVLNRLFDAPNRAMRRVDLAEQVGLSPSGITRLLNPMEKIGLIGKEANPRDARVSLVALTDAGQRVFEEAQVSFGHAAQGVFARLDSTQQSALAELIDSV